MKRFRYSLESVLDYKTQVLDNLKTEHAIILSNVNRKQYEINSLKTVLNGYQNDFNEAKNEVIPIENYRLFDMCIERMEHVIEAEKEKLQVLKRQEEAKKLEVVDAKVDTSKFENLKSKRLEEYHKAEMKEEEAFAEEFVTHTLMFSGQQEELEYQERNEW